MRNNRAAASMPPFHRPLKASKRATGSAIAGRLLSAFLIATITATAGAFDAPPRQEPQWAPDVFGGYSSSQFIIRVTPGLERAAAQRIAARGLPQQAQRGQALRNAMSPALRQVADQWQVRNLRPFYPHPFQSPETAAALGLDRLFVVEVPARTNTPALAAAFALHHEDIEAAGVDEIGGVAGDFLPVIPNDPEFHRQWSLHNPGDENLGWIEDADINAPEAWTIHTGIGGDVVVAVIDSGVDPHPEFADRMVPGTNTVPSEPEDSTFDGCPHGTHIAGIIAAGGDNGQGIAGISWGAKIMPIDVLTGCAGTSTDLAVGIIWAADNGADIINMSLQYYNLTSLARAILENALNYAHARNVLAIAAAGNGGRNDVAFPARLANCMAVSGTDFRDGLGSFSNWGDTVDIAAPGDSIYSTWVNNGFRESFGTSMATAHVSGVAALIKSHTPELTNDAIAQILKDTSVDLGAPGPDPLFGAGRIDAFAALLASESWPRIIGSDPPDGAIDARQPLSRDLSEPAGWSAVRLNFAGDAAVVAADDFLIRQVGGVASAPTVAAVQPLEGGVVEITLNNIIEVGAWTIITHRPSATEIRLGYLPGDVDGNGVTNPKDVIELIDALNGEGPPRGIWSLDVDRSGVALPADILMVIDLLNGAAPFDSYLSATLPPL